MKYRTIKKKKESVILMGKDVMSLKVFTPMLDPYRDKKQTRKIAI